jgi:hypothetical protein
MLNYLALNKLNKSAETNRTKTGFVVWPTWCARYEASGCILTSKYLRNTLYRHLPN